MASEGRRRRRAWTPGEKRAIVAESLAPGASVSLVARRHDLNTNLLFNWRRQARSGELGPEAPARSSCDGRSVPLELVPIEVKADSEVRPTRGFAPGAGIIEIEMRGGVRIRVDTSVDQQALRRVLIAVKGS